MLVIRRLALSLAIVSSQALLAAPKAFNHLGLDLSSGSGSSNEGAESLLGYGLNFQRPFALPQLANFYMGPSVSFRQWQLISNNAGRVATSDLRIFSIGSSVHYMWRPSLRSGLRYELGRAFGKMKIDRNDTSTFETVEATGYEGFSHMIEAPTTWTFASNLSFAVSPFYAHTNLKTQNQLAHGQTISATQNGIQTGSTKGASELPSREMTHQVYGLSLMVGASF